MFWTSISTSLRSQVSIPAALRSRVIISMPVWMLSSFLPPVQTALPERNIRMASLGSFTLYTTPGNCSGSYSQFSCMAMSGRSSSSATLVEATTLTTVSRSSSLSMGARTYMLLINASG